MTWHPAAGPLGRRIDLVGVGEAMVALLVPGGQSLQNTSTLDVTVAGAELTACAAAVALGGRAAFCSRVGNDPLGERVRLAVQRLGVDDQLLATDAARRTGVFLKQTAADDRRRVWYYRDASAASAMGPSVAVAVWQSEPRALLISGLTAALGAAPAGLIRRLASGRDGPPGDRPAVVLDPNLRPQLGGLDQVVALIRSVLGTVDLLCIGQDEAQEIFGCNNPEEIVAAATAAGVGETFVKGGSSGCWSLGSRGVTHHPPKAKVVIDPIGAGDVLTGGYVAARLAGHLPCPAAAIANELAGRAVATAGDVEGLPSQAEGRALLHHPPDSSVATG